MIVEEYIVKDLQEVVGYYAKDFKPQNGAANLRCIDTFVDAAKSKVVFRFFVEKSDQHPG